MKSANFINKHKFDDENNEIKTKFNQIGILLLLILILSVILIVMAIRKTHKN